LQLLSVAVHHADEFAAAFATIVAYRPEVLFIASDGLLSIHRQQIIDFATTHQLPTVGGERRYAEAGSLLTFGYSLREIQQRAAVYVDKILRGARPEDLPIERAMTFELIINLKTAQALGLTLPPTLLFQATEVIR
jgi:putative ABC transport system substrate-binding protein